MNKIRLFRCKHCSLHLVNHSVQEINAHMISEHPKKKQLHENKVATPKKKKLFNKKKKQINDILRGYGDLKKRYNELKEKTKKIRAGRKYPPHPFYDSREWRELRYRALQVYGRKCACCGSSKNIHVDHIKPRSKYPELQLEFSNLQILCEACNLGKGAWDETDWNLK